MCELLLVIKIDNILFFFFFSFSPGFVLRVFNAILSKGETLEEDFF